MFGGGGDKENASPAQSNKKRDGPTTPEAVRENGDIVPTKIVPLNDQTKSDVGNEVNKAPLKRKSSLNTKKKDDGDGEESDDPPPIVDYIDKKDIRNLAKGAEDTSSESGNDSDDI